MSNTNRAIPASIVKIAVTACLIVAGPVIGCSQTPAEKGHLSKVRAELMQLERDIGKANIDRDKAFFEKVEANEFIFTDSAGGTTTKAEDVASLDMPQGDLKLVSYDLDAMRVSVYKGAAVVTGSLRQGCTERRVMSQIEAASLTSL